MSDPRPQLEGHVVWIYEPGMVIVDTEVDVKVLATVVSLVIVIVTLLTAAGFRAVGWGFGGFDRACLSIPPMA